MFLAVASANGRRRRDVLEVEARGVKRAVPQKLLDGVQRRAALHLGERPRMVRTAPTYGCQPWPSLPAMPPCTLSTEVASSTFVGATETME